MAEEGMVGAVQPEGGSVELLRQDVAGQEGGLLLQLGSSPPLEELRLARRHGAVAGWGVTRITMDCRLDIALYVVLCFLTDVFNNLICYDKFYM